ncbi:MAG TPA: FtsX-like permease family protein, partial [Bdellovibrio sp.]|nr:FtsX-like permease family protein [Bdellovibrio sp.]
ECDVPQVQLSVTTETEQLNAMDFDIAGIVDGGFKEIDNRFVMMPLPAAQQLLNTDKVSYVVMTLKNTHQDAEFKKIFNEEIGKQFPDLRLTRWQDHPAGELYRQTIDMFSIFRNFVVIVIISITTLSVANTKIKSIKERTKEIGTLRSIGFEAPAIRSIFLWESFFLSAFGILIGVISSLLTSLIVNRAAIYYKAGLLSMPVPLNIKVDVNLYCAAAIVLILIGLIVTAVICRGTLGKKIVENLGHV